MPVRGDCGIVHVSGPVAPLRLIMTDKQVRRTTGGIFLAVLCVVGFAVVIKLAMAMSLLRDDSPIEPVRPSLPQPSPIRQPIDVVHVQMDALRNNSAVYPDAGIEVSYLFTSLQAKAAIGTLDEFASLLHGPVYRDLLNHQGAWFGDVTVSTNGLAHLPVMVRTASNREAGYIFVLVRQPDGSLMDCWLTDRIIRVR